MNDQTSRAAGVFLFGHMQQIRGVTVTFLDGATVSGFIKEATMTDEGPRITLCRHSTERNESPYVGLDFDSIQSLVVTLHSGATQRF